MMPLNGPFNEVAPDATAISARTAKFWVVFMLRLEGDETQTLTLTLTLALALALTLTLALTQV